VSTVATTRPSDAVSTAASSPGPTSAAEGPSSRRIADSISPSESSPTQGSCLVPRYRGGSPLNWQIIEGETHLGVSLLQMFADNDEVIEIVGEDGRARLETWNKNIIAGRFAYDIVPDSQKMLDTATDRAQQMQLYNLTAKDPNLKRTETLTPLLKAFGMDPVKAMQQPPEPPPTQPAMSVAIKGEDFIGPQAPIMIHLAEEAGFEIPDEIRNQATANSVRAQMAELDRPIEPTQPDHPGPADKASALDKGQGENTGQLDGQGSGTGRV